jgi:hypothetical protein
MPLQESSRRASRSTLQGSADTQQGCVRPADKLLTHCCWLLQQLTDMRKNTAPLLHPSCGAHDTCSTASQHRRSTGGAVCCALHTRAYTHNHTDTELALTSGSARRLLNFFTRICEDTLLCETTSSPGAAPLPPPLPAASFPAAWLLLSDLLLDAALSPAASEAEPCSCNWPRPEPTESACCSRSGEGLCEQRETVAGQRGTSLQPSTWMP